MSFSKITFIPLVMTAAFLFSGCSLAPTSSSTTTARADGGIWHSTDQGFTWSQINQVLAVQGKATALDNLSVSKLVFDPQDPLTIYLATPANGIFYTLDGGATWAQFKAMTQGAITDIAVDFQNKCYVYAISGNKLFRTDNCGRDWKNIYVHQKPQVTLTSLALDNKNGKLVYLGTSAGELLKSVDGGLAWSTIYRDDKNSKISDIINDPNNHAIVYLGMATDGIIKSTDSGNSWTPLNIGLASYAGSQQYRQLIADPATKNGLIFSSKFGVLKSVDGGDTWQVIELLPEHKNTDILTIAVNPKNSQEFYYATAQAFVKTRDGGATWSSLKLPTTRVVTDVAISPASSQAVYLTSVGKK